MYKLLKKIYWKLPFKKQVYSVVKVFYTPTRSIALYLKFKGFFKIKIGTKFYHFKNENTAIETLLFWKGITSYEPQSISVWSKLSMKSKVIFDVGANSGLFSIVASEFSKKGTKIIGIEPLPRIMSMYKTNTLLNGIEPVFIQKAVSSTNGNAIFYDMNSFDNQIGSLVKSHVLKHEHHKSLIEIRVELTTIDEVFESMKLKRLDLIKIDVEGVEDLVIQGMVNVLMSCKPFILIEISNSETAKKLNFIFKNLDYKYFEVNESEGLIVKESISKSKELNYLLCPKSRLETLNNIMR